MAVSSLVISNLALSHVGEPKISSFNEDSKAAIQCSLHYEHARDFVLRTGRFNFMKRPLALAALGATIPTNKWTYWYQMPSDNLRLLKVTDVDGCPIHHELLGDKLFTDVDPPQIVHLSKNLTGSNDGNIPSDVAKAIGFYLALQIAPAISQTPALLGMLNDQYQQAMRECRFTHSSENEPESISASSWLASRQAWISVDPRLRELDGIPPEGTPYP